MTLRGLATHGSLLIAILAAACRLGPETCDTSVPPAIDVEIVDAVTRVPLAKDAIGLVQAGAFVDTLRPHRSDGSQLVSRATTRTGPGTYDVRVTHDGFEPWILANVRVSVGSCGTEPRVLTAELQPVSTP